jgi:hypothetical protein
MAQYQCGVINGVMANQRNGYLQYNVAIQRQWRNVMASAQ